ncbi:MAG: hypothetical protein HZB38_06455 [Planctomycetes bacterium]|nr:hypothetical protein [Planctomycetota bacterium]
MIETLGLTEEQQAAFGTIREETQTATQARQEQARQEFRGLLPQEQLATLDEFEANHPHP